LMVFIEKCICSFLKEWNGREILQWPLRLSSQRAELTNLSNFSLIHICLFHPALQSLNSHIRGHLTCYPSCHTPWTVPGSFEKTKFLGERNGRIGSGYLTFCNGFKSYAWVSTP
jgi:hypothetical protein